MSSIFYLALALVVSSTFGELEFQAGQCKVEMKCTGMEEGNGYVIGAPRDDCDCTRPLCPQTKFKFPNAAQSTNYIRYKPVIPTLTELSMCMWVTSEPTGEASVVSYSTNSNANMLVVLLQEGTLQVYRKTKFTASTTNDTILASKTHVCVTISTPQKLATVYLNGVKNKQISFNDDRPIEGGGSLIFGHEQDEVIGDFERSQAFGGEIENLMMWYRQLTPAEISLMYNVKCACAVGYDVALIPEWIQLNGAVTAMPITPC